ncbi:MAG: VWA domain-containing protein [Methylotenera sp.]|jgi:mxaC protein|uniref:vWA domain-containing protein n=1 Tax=Methylotenera sp. TaxID=2051956 RepID=UPI0027231A1F|nr:VWA domain-containing protein [Methylotenera sp.]MDO9203951.1 VWA domain-containing protein [Methylotenera sp.]MDO9393968.1 VWA domain-containing protein [Methylotenera sp.]MDP1522420.1 VWA domain-containing protein [Methylotenera sp.]MDP2072490.1 VWA domain-containing protein [Methylotenera sp.]MDP2229521.1 VWA domain-containing protein [Methylotenera sp.]
MNALHFFKPELLWLLPLALLPLISYGVKQFNFPGLEDWPKDFLSDWLRWGVRVLAALTLAALIIAAAAPFTEGGTVTKVGEGAEIVVVLDRSGSMSENLQSYDQSVNAKPISKIEAARKVLLKFMEQRPADTFGVVAFNAAPVSVAPLSADRELAKAAMQSAEANSSGFTALNRALAMGLDYFNNRPFTASRLILLVSDGDAVIEPADRIILKNAFKQTRAKLIWVYVHAGAEVTQLSTVIAGDNEIITNEGLAKVEMDQNLAMNKLFEELEIPYQAFEVNSEAGLQQAVAEIGRATNKPTRYEYRLPRQDYAVYFYMLTMGLLGVLFWLKQIEIKAWKP